MNIIFLDVDGVLNSQRYALELWKKTHIQRNGENYPFDEECMKNFQTLVRATNAKIVVSSTWRKSESEKRVLLRKLKEYGLDEEVIGYTPIINEIGPTRGQEIKAFLANLKGNHNFIIVDNSINLDDLLPYFVRVNLEVGLTTENVKEAIEKLNRTHNEIQSITIKKQDYEEER